MTSPVNYNTPDRVIRTAMINAGKLQDGDDPTSEKYAQYMPRLNDIFNFFQITGLKLWLNQDLAVPLVAGQALYTLGPLGSVNMTKPMRIIQGYFLDPFGNRTPLIPMSREEYVRLSQVNQQGALNSYFVDKQQLTLNVFFWLTPDPTAALGVAHPIIQQQVTNLVSLNDSMNFPQEWFSALHWGLCEEISTGQPQAICDRAEKMAKKYKDALEDWDVEDASTSFAPDQRGTYFTSAFR